MGGDGAVLDFDSLMKVCAKDPPPHISVTSFATNTTKHLGRVKVGNEGTDSQAQDRYSIYLFTGMTFVVLIAWACLLLL